MPTPKPIHISITITVDGKPVAYEKWVTKDELALYLEGCAKQTVRQETK